MSDVSLRPATAADAEAVAVIWWEGWRLGHLGHVPEALVAVRTPESFRARAAARIADTVVAIAGPAHKQADAMPAADAMADQAGVPGGQVAGFVMVVRDEVEQVYVAAAHRGSGVAGVLLAEAERLVAAGGYGRAWLAVVAGNVRARRFYERSGWVDDGLFDYAAAVPGGVLAVPAHRYLKRVTTSPA